MMKMKVYLCIGLCLLPILAFSQNFKDTAGTLIRERDVVSLDLLLQNNIESENYEALEIYVVESAKKYIIEDEYEYAQDLLKVVLTNNLENVAAQELYTVLQSTIQERLRIEEESRIKEAEAKRKEEEEQKKLEEQRQAEEEERIRKEKAKEEEARLIAEEQARIEAEEKRIEEITVIERDNFSFGFGGSPLNVLLYHSDYYDDYFDTVKANLKYGIGLEFAGFFRHPFVRAGVDITFDTAFLNLINTSGIPFSYNIYVSGTSPVIRIPLYLVTGFSHLIYFFGREYLPEEIDVQTMSLASPVLGLRIGNVHYTKGFLGVDFSSLYYLVSLRKNKEGDEAVNIVEYDAVFDTTLRILISSTKPKPMQGNLGVRLGAFFIISNGKLEINSKILFNVGARVYGK